MNSDKLWETRFKPMLAEVYAESKGPTDAVWPQNWESWKKHPVWGFYHDEDKPVIIIPADIYHCDRDKMKSILAKWCKGLHGFWYYTPKLDFKDPEYENKVKEMEDFRKFEDEVSKDKSLTYAQRAAKIKKEALAHNFRWRSRDKEFIEHNFWLGVSPTSSQDNAMKAIVMYQAIERVYNRGGFKNTYVDYTHMPEFEYRDKFGRICQARMENIRKWLDKDNKIKEKKIDVPVCNLYIDGIFVDDLWNYEDETRRMSAETFQTMETVSKPLVISMLFDMGHVELANDIEKDANWVSKEYKQCLALFINHLDYIAHK